jgi:glycogen debranching enzyme
MDAASVKKTDERADAPWGDEESPFYISATSSIQEFCARTLKHGDTFAMFDNHGDILNAANNPAGIFHEDTRYLSGSYLLIDGHRPLLLSSTLQDDNAVLTVDLANPDIYRGDELVLSRETLHVTRTKFLWQAACYERIAVENFDSKPHRTRLLLWFAADFADLFEVRGMQRAARGTCRSEVKGRAGILYHYKGLDGVDRYTDIEFGQPPARLDARHADFDMMLEPGGRWSCVVVARFGPDPFRRTDEFVTALVAARRSLRKRAAQTAAVSTSNEVLNQVLCRSVADLSMLVTETPHGPYPYAGIPWFSTAFGRDGIITALETLELDAGIAKGVLKFLAATQATAEDPKADAEPGKILHETRHGEMAGLGEVPFGLYYGSVDATPLFVLLAGRYFERTGDLATIRGLWPNIEAALRWIDSYGDPDRDGFVEYMKKSETGLGNQGWKDSKDSIVHADGSLALGAIALCEVQAYVFAAKRHAARLVRLLGEDARANALEREAEELRRRFEDAFWCEDLGTYALALDGDKNPCRVRTSNAGHALFAGIASAERARHVAKTLLRADSYSGWGIRTMSHEERRYNPMSYHNGSVWPHDNALIALGFARYGLKREAAEVFSGLFDAIHYMGQMRLPELFCGFPRRKSNAPTLYPVACTPQAWASVAPFALLGACLGMTCEHAAREVRFDRPLLPGFIDQAHIRNLRLGEGTIDLLLERRGDDEVAIDVLEQTGDIRLKVVR